MVETNRIFAQLGYLKKKKKKKKKKNYYYHPKKKLIEKKKLQQFWVINLINLGIECTSILLLANTLIL